MALAIPPPSETLFVTGLPVDCTNEFATQIFNQYGTVKSATVLPVKPGKSAAAGFVIMTNLDDATWIVEHVNGNVPQMLTNPVTIVYATPKEMLKPKNPIFNPMMKGMMKGGMGMSALMGGMGGLGGLGGGAASGLGALGGESPASTLPPGTTGADIVSQFAAMSQARAAAGGFGAGGAGGGGAGGGGAGGGGAGGGCAPSIGVVGGGGGGKGLPQEVRKYKTIMCRYWEKDGKCMRADSCTYAHGAQELRAAKGAFSPPVSTGMSAAEQLAATIAAGTAAGKFVPSPSSGLTSAADGLNGAGVRPPFGVLPVRGGFDVLP
mmetsp:Transcript_22917/g.51571  ORF Transcript_22917/g.51571 Transcript_22917/m.51571 type:complete len:321 (+) Transcript_22917:75-1037(+)